MLYMMFESEQGARPKEMKKGEGSMSSAVCQFHGLNYFCFCFVCLFLFFGFSDSFLFSFFFLNRSQCLVCPMHDQIKNQCS